MTMRLPDAAEHVKVAPVKVLRAIFAGVGQLLLAADRFKAEESGYGNPGGAEHPDPLRPWETGHEIGEPARADRKPAEATKAAHADQAGEQSRFRSLDSTGNVRLLTTEDVAKSSPSSPAALPISQYDGLSLPSLRARLRNLDSAQLQVLISYERSHANREDVVRMFERRIARLQADQA